MKYSAVLLLLLLFVGCDPVAYKKITININKIQYNNYEIILENVAVNRIVAIVSKVVIQYNLQEMKISDEYQKKYNVIKLFGYKMDNNCVQKCYIRLDKECENILIEVTESPGFTLKNESKEMVKKIYSELLNEFEISQ